MYLTWAGRAFLDSANIGNHSLPLPRHSSFPGGDAYFSIDGCDDQRDHQFAPETRRHILPKPRRLQHDSKRQRVMTTPDHCHGEHNVTRSPRSVEHSGISPVKPVVDLSPCHICYRKPTVRSDLDSFANCESCGKRTCYICIRECEGYMSGYDADVKNDHELEHLEEPMKKLEHKGMICSRCCVERGAEGEVWCLGCLRAEEAVGWDGS